MCLCSSGWDLGVMEALCPALPYLAGSHRNMTLRQLCGPEYTQMCANVVADKFLIFASGAQLCENSQSLLFAPGSFVDFPVVAL